MSFFSPISLHRSRTTFSYIASAALRKANIREYFLDPAPLYSRRSFLRSFLQLKRVPSTPPLPPSGISYRGDSPGVYMCTCVRHTRISTCTHRETLRLFIKKLLAILNCPREELELFRDGRRTLPPPRGRVLFDHHRECELDPPRDIRDR